jgi:hypothetical protein
MMKEGQLEKNLNAPGEKNLNKSILKNALLSPAPIFFFQQHNTRRLFITSLYPTQILFNHTFIFNKGSGLIPLISSFPKLPIHPRGHHYGERKSAVYGP